MNKQTKTKIRLGSVVKTMAGELEKITRDGRSMRMSKEVMGFVQNVVGRNKFLIIFEDGQKKETSSSLLVYLSSKEEVEMEEPISHLPVKEQGGLLTINGDPEVGEPCMFVKGMYLSVFYCLCYDTNISTDMSEDQVAEERDPDLNEEEDIRLDDIREEHWSDVAEEGDNKKNICSLRWEIYVIEKEELIKR